MNGYPAILAERSPRFTSFDQQAGPTMYPLMDIVPADAAHEGVWSFISLVLLPDVALWRFPNRRLRDDYERILGRPRNVFRRLWWRAHIFGTGPADPGSLLLEDEAVAIIERPTLGGDARLANIIARTHLRWIREHPETQRTELMREATKRIRRLASVLTFGALDDADLALAITDAFSAAARSMVRRTVA